MSVRTLTSKNLGIDFEGEAYGFYDELTIEYERRVKIKSKGLGLINWNSFVLTGLWKTAESQELSFEYAHQGAL